MKGSQFLYSDIEIFSLDIFPFVSTFRVIPAATPSNLVPPLSQLPVGLSQAGPVLGICRTRTVEA
jgi:hypothetical protein